MTILPVIALCAVLLCIAYVTYGKWVMRWFGVDAGRQTPAVEYKDGVDFVPAPTGIVLGGHFTAIAAAGPVLGPILAGYMFGWLPALIWIVVGAIFIGAVHDSGALFASLRHRAASITQVVREQMSRPAYIVFLWFVWVCLIYVVIAFADVTAGTFARFQQLPIVVNGLERPFSINGGAVAVGASAYLIFSVLMGLGLRFTRIHWSALLGVSVIALSAIIWKSPDIAAWLSSAGLTFLDTSGRDPANLGMMQKHWDQVLLAYCFIASVVPMWLLLQPRGVIGATFLYAAIAFSVLGMLIGGWDPNGSLAIQWPAYKGFTADGQWLFPVLFITIACGACSGFHSIVASGTTCKQVRSESEVRPIGYGSMLLEAMVAIFALSCVMVMAPETKQSSPEVVYARGLGNFMNLCGIPLEFAIGFGLLAFSSFVFDTLDVCTRLGRYVMQEMLGIKGIIGGVIATVLTLAAPSFYLYASPPGSFRQFWTLFGSSNQLLAALTLVAVALWLRKTGKRAMFAAIPALFMVATTATALVMNCIKFYGDWQKTGAYVPLMNLAIAAGLLLMSGFVVAEALRAWLTPASSHKAPETVVAG